MTDLQKQLAKAFPAENFEFDKPLAPLTYFKIGGPAEVFLEITSENQAQKILDFAHENQVRITILGGASNVIISDKGLRGIVLNIKADSVQKLQKIDQQIDNKTIVEAESGIKTALLVSKTVALGLQGLEYFLGVPGTLGGAVYNNSHYLGQLIGDHIDQVYVLKPGSEGYWLSHEECDFAYDHSRFHSTNELIWKTHFALLPGNRDESNQKIAEATRYRATTQPLGIPSSGCIFQNVPNTPELQERFEQFADKSHVPGGFLIDKAGLKGKRVGSIEVSDKHAAWMINLGDGKSEDVRKLIDLVKSEVNTKFGVNLKEEVFFLE